MIETLRGSFVHSYFTLKTIDLEMSRFNQFVRAQSILKIRKAEV